MVDRDARCCFPGGVLVADCWCDRPPQGVIALRTTDGANAAAAAPARHREQLPNVGRQDLTILWLEGCDAIATSTPDRGPASTLLWDLARPLLQHHAARYVANKRRGHAILAGFDNANAGLRGAWCVREVLQRVGVLVRMGMHWGCTVVHVHPLTSCVAMIGASVHGAVRLARLARPNEMLIAAELRDHPEVQQDHFVFLPEQRWLQDDGGRTAAPPTVSCYVMALVSTTTGLLKS